MASYVIHGTTLDNLIHILKSGCLETNPKHAKKFLDEEHYNPHQIFTQILFKDLPDEVHQRPHWWGVGIVLDKKILKEQKWYATRIGGFREHFDDAFNQNSEDAKILAKNENPNVARIPSLKKLKTHITSRMESHLLGEAEFIHSHEVLFGENISLEEYGLAIICPRGFTKILSEKNREYITRRCAELGVPLILYGNSKRIIHKEILGINKFIDLVDSSIL
jgi:hypothetical protein